MTIIQSAIVGAVGGLVFSLIRDVSLTIGTREYTNNVVAFDLKLQLFYSIAGTVVGTVVHILWSI